MQTPDALITCGWTSMKTLFRANPVQHITPTGPSLKVSLCQARPLKDCLVSRLLSPDGIPSRRIQLSKFYSPDARPLQMQSGCLPNLASPRASRRRSHKVKLLREGSEMESAGADNSLLLSTPSPNSSPIKSSGSRSCKHILSGNVDRVHVLDSSLSSKSSSICLSSQVKPASRPSESIKTYNRKTWQIENPNKNFGPSGTTEPRIPLAEELKTNCTSIIDPSKRTSLHEPGSVYYAHEMEVFCNPNNHNLVQTKTIYASPLQQTVKRAGATPVPTNCTASLFLNSENYAVFKKKQTLLEDTLVSTENASPRHPPFSTKAVSFSQAPLEFCRNNPLAKSMASPQIDNQNDVTPRRLTSPNLLAVRPSENLPEGELLRRSSQPIRQHTHEQSPALRRRLSDYMLQPQISELLSNSNYSSKDNSCSYVIHSSSEILNQSSISNTSCDAAKQVTTRSRHRSDMEVQPAFRKLNEQPDKEDANRRNNPQSSLCLPLAPTQQSISSQTLQAGNHPDLSKIQPTEQAEGQTIDKLACISTVSECRPGGFLSIVQEKDEDYAECSHVEDQMMYLHHLVRPA